MFGKRLAHAAIVLGFAIAGASAARAQNIWLGPVEPANSWLLSFGLGGVAFDEVQVHYVPSGDFGGGKLEAPYLDLFRVGPTASFASPVDPSWSTLPASNPTFGAARGTRVDGILGSRYFHATRLNLDGASTLGTEFDLVYYDSGVWSGAYRLHWRTLPGGTSGFSDYTQDQFDPGSVIPEPGTLTLLGLGLAGLSIRRRRRQRSN